MVAAVKQGTAPGLLLLFLLTIIMPIEFNLGSTKLSPVRLYLLVAIVPFAVRILMGKVGRVTWIDILFTVHGLWLFLSLIITTGGGRVPFAGITTVELVGGYFVGRVLVRNEADYRRMIRFMVVALICLMPFAVIESLTGKLVIPDLLRPFFDTPYRGRSAYGRWGLERVYGVFDHPILWGLFCSMVLSNVVMLARGRIMQMLPGAAVSLYGTFLSLSSAPLLAIMLQIMMLAWGWVMRGRWRLLILLTIAAYVLVDALSNRTPVTILISTLTFNPVTGYTRIAIFDYAWAAVKTSPWFGLGFDTWDKPGWLTGSVDNFWLVTAIRSGMVGAAMLIAAFVLHLYLLGRAKLADPGLQAVRVGHAIALVGVAFTLATVHIWGGVAVFVMFYVGAGAWLYADDHSLVNDGAPEAPAAPVGKGPRYTRFAAVSRAERQGVAAPMQAAMPAPMPGAPRGAPPAGGRQGPPSWRRPR